LGVINNGTEDVLYRFYTALLIDGIETYRWYSDPPLSVNYYTYVLDFNLGKLSSGEHVVTILRMQPTL